MTTNGEGAGEGVGAGAGEDQRKQPMLQSLRNLNLLISYPTRARQDDVARAPKAAAKSDAKKIEAPSVQD